MIQIPTELGLFLAQHLVETVSYPEALDIYEQLNPEEFTEYQKICFSEALLEEGKVKEAYEFLKSFTSDNEVYPVLLGKCETLLNLSEARTTLDRALLQYQGTYLFDTLFGAFAVNKGLKDYMELAATIYPNSEYRNAYRAAEAIRKGKSIKGSGLYVEAANYFAEKNVVLTGNPYQTFEYLAPLATVSGNVLEFGVRNAYSTRKLAELFKDSNILGFDSFKGLPEDWGTEKKGRYNIRGKIPHVDGVFMVEGEFQDTLPAIVRDCNWKARLINIDCDIYSSTKFVLDTLTPCIVPGTIIVFDEYILNPTWKDDECKAFEEWVKEQNISYEFLTVSLYSKQVSVRIL